MNFKQTTPLLAVFAMVAHAQIATVRTSGQYDTDGTVLYSVYVATSAQKLTGVAVGGTVPLGTRFLEVVDLPAGVSFEGVRDNVAVWGLKEIPADRLIGPFTFRAKPDGAAPVIAEPSAAVSYQQPEPGLAEYAGTQNPLVPTEPKGSLTFDQRGTLNDKNENAPVYVAKTGVLLFVPEGAVLTQTTFTVERQAIDESRLPKTDVPLWWCGLYAVSVSPSISSLKDFGIAFPTRRNVPLGIPVTISSNTDNGFVKASDPVRAIGFGGGGFGSPFCIPSGFGQLACRSSGGFGGGFGQFGFGVTVADRTASSVSGAQLSNAFNVPTTPTTAIQDGTSNIIAILIGRR